MRQTRYDADYDSPSNTSASSTEMVGLEHSGRAKHVLSGSGCGFDGPAAGCVGTAGDNGVWSADVIILGLVWG